MHLDLGQRHTEGSISWACGHESSLGRIVAELGHDVASGAHLGVGVVCSDLMLLLNITSHQRIMKMSAKKGQW